MIYFQNKNSACTGTGLFRTSVLFEKPSYTMLNCDLFVVTDEITLSEIVRMLDDSYETPYMRKIVLSTGQTIYHIAATRNPTDYISVDERWYVYKDADDGRIYDLYSRETIRGCKIGSPHIDYIGDSKRYLEFRRVLNRENTDSVNHIAIGTVDKISDNMLMKIVVTEAAKFMHSIFDANNLKIYADEERTKVMIVGKLYDTSYRIATYSVINNHIIELLYKRIVHGKLVSFLRGCEDISKSVSDFCKEHYIEMKRGCKVRLHTQGLFDFETLKHDPEVDAAVKSAESQMKSYGEYVNAKNDDALKQLKAMNYKAFCTI